MDERCMICLQDLSEGDELTIQCGHKFHQSCILNWFRSPQCSGNCPLCNDNPHSARSNPVNYYYLSTQNKIQEQRFRVVKRELKKQKNIDERDQKLLQTIQEDVKQLKDLEQTVKGLKKDEHFVKIKKDIQDTQKKMWKCKHKILSNKIKIISKQPLTFF